MNVKEENYNSMIHEIIENFDFKKCRNVMVMLNWGWGFGNELPTIEQLKKSARKRLENVLEGLKNKDVTPNVPYLSSSGGLKAEGWKNRYGHVIGLKLEFILTEWESDGDTL